MRELQQIGSTSARALEWLILTACSRGDILGQGTDQKPGASWNQIDWKARVWTIPSTKPGTESRVPLSDAAMALLGRMDRKGAYIFPGDKPRSPINKTGFDYVIKQMNKARAKEGKPLWTDPKELDAGGKPREVTPHGFRSTFSTWAADRTSFPYEIREAALRHSVGNETAQAYQRGDLLEKRRKLMEAWGKFCTADAAASGKVVPIRKGVRA
jgi:integrase